MTKGDKQSVKTTLRCANMPVLHYFPPAGVFVRVLLAPVTVPPTQWVPPVEYLEAFRVRARPLVFVAALSPSPPQQCTRSCHRSHPNSKAPPTNEQIPLLVAKDLTWLSFRFENTCRWRGGRFSEGMGCLNTCSWDFFGYCLVLNTTKSSPCLSRETPDSLEC